MRYLTTLTGASGMCIPARWATKAGSTTGPVATTAGGTLTCALAEGVKATYPFYAIRLVGGTLFLGGMLLMAYNVLRTAVGATSVEALIPAATPVHVAAPA